MIRLGILAVSDELGVDRIKLALPPKHAVIAEREHSHLFITELLIEGPDMPECVDPAKPAVVQMNFQRFMILGAMPTTYRMEAYWQHDPQKRWIVPDVSPEVADRLSIKVILQETRRQTDIYAESLKDTLNLLRAIQQQH